MVQATPTALSPRIRLDKWLWAARLLKTRALAIEQIDLGRVSVNGQAAKASREVHIGDRIAWRQGPLEKVIDVLGLSTSRGPAAVAQLLYRETPDSVAARERAALARRQGIEPAATLEQGRPTKRDRRKLVDWQRWSASAEFED